MLEKELCQKILDDMDSCMPNFAKNNVTHYDVNTSAFIDCKRPTSQGDTNKLCYAFSLVHSCWREIETPNDTDLVEFAHIKSISESVI